LPVAYGLNERHLWWDYRRQATLDEMRRHARDWAEYDAARLMLDRLSAEFGCSYTHCWDAIVVTFSERSEARPMTAGVRALAGGFHAGPLLGMYGRSCGEFAVAALVRAEGWSKLSEDLGLGSFDANRAREEERARARAEEGLRRLRDERLRAVPDFAAPHGGRALPHPAPPGARAAPSVPVQQTQPEPTALPPRLEDSGYWQRRKQQGY
jgi:hypothetical protein